MKNDLQSETENAPPKQLNLLFVIKSLSLQGGGAERVLTLLASMLSGRHHRVTIVTFDPRDGPDFYHLDATVRRKWLAVADSDQGASLASFACCVGGLRAILRESRPDVAIGFMHSAFAPLGIAALGLGIPIVASEHTAYAHYDHRHLQRFLVRFGAPLYRAITTTSRSVGNTFPHSLARRMTVMPNPVATAMPHVSAKCNGPRHRVLCVGGLRPEKGQSVLIDAFSQIAPRFPDWDLHLVGEGPMLRVLRSQVAQLKLTSRIIFRGAISDVTPEYQNAQIFATPSVYESFGLATAEALAQGVPAIGFADCPGTNEIVHDGVNGVLVIGEPRARHLAEGLAALMASPDRRKILSRGGPPSIAAFSIDMVTLRWEKMLLDIARRAAISV